MNIFIKGALKSICQTPNLGPFRDSLYCLSPWVWVMLSYFLLSLLKFYTEAGHFRQCIVTILYPVLLFFRLWFFFLLIWTETLELPPLWYLVDVSAKVCCCCFFFGLPFPSTAPVSTQLCGHWHVRPRVCETQVLSEGPVCGLENALRVTATSHVSLFLRLTGVFSAQNSFPVTQGCVEAHLSPSVALSFLEFPC